MENTNEIQRFPLYLQVASAIEKRLQTKRWPADQALPSEARLSQLFNVSVGTVRKAVGELEDRGHLIRRHGSGTYVRRYADAGYWHQFQRFQSIDQRIVRWTGELKRFERIPADKTVAEALKIREGDNVIHVVRRGATDAAYRHLLDTAGWDQSWLRADVFENLTPQAYTKYADLSLYELYEKAAGVIILDVSDTLEVLEVMGNPLDETEPAEPGPFFKVTRLSRTFGNQTVEYRLETPKCRGIKVVF